MYDCSQGIWLTDLSREIGRFLKQKEFVDFWKQLLSLLVKVRAEEN